MNGTLNNQTVFIIGGSSGMGLATAAAAATEGARVLVTGRDASRLGYVQRQLGTRVEVHVVDAIDPLKMTELFDKVDRIDHVFSTIGDYFPDRVLQADLAGIESSMMSRYRSAVLIARLAGPKIRAAGSITYITGIAAWKPMGSVAAAASCAAVESMAATLAVGLAPVRVNCIAPGSIRTGMFAALPEAVIETISHKTPAGRVGRPEEIASAVLFLMKNEFVTGTTMVVDGGLRLV